MIYSIFSKKIYKDARPFALNRVLQWYTTNFGVDDFIIFLPGCMSTTPNGARQFVGNLPVSHYGYFTKGYRNTRNFAVGGVPYTNMQDYYNNLLSNINGLCTTGGEDHSKMMFFLENDANLYNNIQQLQASHIQTNLDVFANQAVIKAVLIGSSNQSKQTYLGNNNRADKGEADILLMDSNVIQGLNDDCFNEHQMGDDVVISRQIGGNANMLREIFRKTIRL